MSVRTGVGVDWASGSWVVVAVSESGFLTASVADEIDAVVDPLTEGTTVVADVPIGLCSGCYQDDDSECNCTHDGDGECYRAVDEAARRLVSPRYSSVFTPPCREVVEDLEEDGENGDSGLSYQEANARNKGRTGKGLMQQAYYITDGIAQVDEFLVGRADEEAVLEGHPEVAFRTLASHPLQYGKQSAAGVSERVDCLETCDEYDPGDLLRAASVLRENSPDTAAAVDLDDLLDAYVLALTAVGADSHQDLQRLPRDWPTDVDGVPDEPPDTAAELPTDEIPTDGKELPMQMVYRTS